MYISGLMMIHIIRQISVLLDIKTNILQLSDKIECARLLTRFIKQHTDAMLVLYGHVFYCLVLHIYVYPEKIHHLDGIEIDLLWGINAVYLWARHRGIAPIIIPTKNEEDWYISYA